MSLVDPPAPRWIMTGTPAYRRVSIALFLAGFACFALLYCVQPLLPIFARHFAVGPTESSLALSLATGCLAGSILGAAALSETLGRRGMMLASILGAASLNILAGWLGDWHALLLVRALEGVMLGGVPAVAMTYLAEEIDPRGLGVAMGLLVAGNACGGMAGRVATGVLAEALSWQSALAMIGATGLASAVGFILLLPPSYNFHRRPDFDLAFHLQAWREHLRNPAMLCLFSIAFLCMGSFVALYNYASFRLTAPPFTLSQGQMGAIFSVYVFGIAASAVAGFAVERLGRRQVLPGAICLTMLGIGTTLLPGLGAMVIGIVLFTGGFFLAHAVASGWVGRLALRAKGHSASLYMLSYYLGSSVIGSLGGWFWGRGGWSWVALFTLSLFGLALAAALGVNRILGPGRDAMG